MVEVTSVSIQNGIVVFEAVDISEARLEWLERTRTDQPEKVVEIIYDTHDSRQANQLRNWIKSQKVTKNCTTWGEALRAVLGTIVPTKYGKLA